FEPVELLERLAVLMPRPRINLVLHHGVLAPHSRWRAQVVAYGLDTLAPLDTAPPAAPLPAAPPPGHRPFSAPPAQEPAPAAEAAPSSPTPRTRSWADLLHHTF